MRFLTLCALVSGATLIAACIDADEAGPAPNQERVLAEFQRPTAG